MAIWMEWTSGFSKGRRHNLSLSPCPDIMAGGLYGSGHGQYNIHDDGAEDNMDKEKPVYRVPTMAETRASDWCGLTVAETFAGGGGSDTGWEMAGYRVLWANEFVPSAQETYAANHFGTRLDRRDIKLVTAEDILAATGLKRGELDVFSGSPPCQSFSSAGKREKGWAVNGGAGKKYEGGAVQHNELLFFEYVRLLEGLQPVAFVAENVKGLTIGAAKKMMGDAQLDAFDAQDDTILHALMDAGYVVRWRVLDAKHHGVPQTRTRVFFVGVRKDVYARLKMRDIPFPRPLPWVYTVRDACPWIGRAVHDTGSDKFERGGVGEITDRTSPTITADGGRRGSTMFSEGAEMIVGNDKFKPKWGSLDNPSPAILAGGPHGGSGEVREAFIQIGDESEKNKPGYSFPKGVKMSLDQPSPSVQTESGCMHGGHGAHIVEQVQARRDPETGQSLEVVPSRQDPDKYGVKEVGPDDIAPTVACASPGNDMTVKTKRRKFTIAEVKRICAFPDDYVLLGSYAKQWMVLGNSVPPLFMRAIAETLRDEVFAKLKKLRWSPRPAEDRAAPAPPARGPEAQPSEPRRPAEPTNPAPKITGKLDDKWANYWASRGLARNEKDLPALP